MKKIYLLAIRWWVFLLNLPFAFLLGVSIGYNSYSEHLFKLYPLIIFLILFIVFLNIYFFRVIEISYDAIKYHGLFSSRDSSNITLGNTLKLTRERFGKWKIVLHGHDGCHADFDWITDEDAELPPQDITLFRGRLYCGSGDVKRILRYFGVGKSDFSKIFKSEGYSATYENVTVSTLKTDVGFEIDITVDKIPVLSDEAIANSLK